MTKPYNIENNTRVYDFKASLQYLETVGKKHFGSKFTICAQDHPIIYKLLVYAIQDQEKCQELNLDLGKGILLLGPIGSGKTSLMYLLRYFFPVEEKYNVHPARDIAFQFITKGYSIVELYGKKPANICFDDLGVEQTLKYYGNDCNVMAEVLLSRYDVFVAQKKVSHATSNLNASELEELYGKRLRSRFRAMFNLIAFPGTTPDKRS